MTKISSDASIASRLSSAGEDDDRATPDVAAAAVDDARRRFSDIEDRVSILVERRAASGEAAPPPSENVARLKTKIAELMQRGIDSLREHAANPPRVYASAWVNGKEVARLYTGNGFQITDRATFEKLGGDAGLKKLLAESDRHVQNGDYLGARVALLQQLFGAKNVRLHG